MPPVYQVAQRRPPRARSMLGIPCHIRVRGQYIGPGSTLIQGGVSVVMPNVSGGLVWATAGDETANQPIPAAKRAWRATRRKLESGFIFGIGDKRKRVHISGGHGSPISTT